MKNAVERCVHDIACAMLPLRVIRRELRLEKKYNNLIGEGNREAFVNFRCLLNLFQKTCPLFGEDMQLAAVLLRLRNGNKTADLRETIKGKLLRITQLFEDDGKLNDNIIRLRITKIYDIITELCENSLPRLLDSLKAVKKTLKDEAKIKEVF